MPMTLDKPDHWRKRSIFDIPPAAPFRVWNKHVNAEFRCSPEPPVSCGPFDTSYDVVVLFPHIYTHWRPAAVGPGHRHGAK